jgi:hypothetical protein
LRGGDGKKACPWSLSPQDVDANKYRKISLNAPTAFIVKSGFLAVSFFYANKVFSNAVRTIIILQDCKLSYPFYKTAKCHLLSPKL